ncbi:histidine kinase [Phyllobacterium sp. 628]|uniref:sensor histidine kinase n=1 Tax=Phyllobacterium sp. 628 TaxID=2718938 RepID=UPI00166272DA|nr:histidine kinase [Phyllobacterium sp. 628]QND53196.1 histidine kinase [Phyllobacterium sp. 628]
MEQNNQSARTGAVESGAIFATLRLVLAYWIVEFVVSSVVWWILGVDPLDSALGKLSLMVITIGLTMLMSVVISKTRNRHFVHRVVLYVLMALAASAVYPIADHIIYMVCMLPATVSFNQVNFVHTFVYGFALFSGWSCLYTALLNHFDIRDQERKLAALREEALSAQIRALNYQITPKFLFTTLSSIAQMVEEGAASQSGKMVLLLAAFMRSILEIDPARDVALAEELDLQAGYLDIERERFPDRLRVQIEVEAGLEKALVPSFILHPLIENAVNFGTATIHDTIDIIIRADTSGDNLNLSVEHDAGIVQRRDEDMHAMRENLTHVRRRIPEIGSLITGFVAPGRFKTSILMPLRLA